MSKSTNKLDRFKPADNYLPIVIFLKNGLRDEQDTIDYKLNKLAPCNENNKSGCESKILLILDGLDEFPGTTKELMSELNKFRYNYPLGRVIITTRLTDNLPTDPNINIDRYVRLLSFTREQVDTFFYKFGVNLTFDSLHDNLGLMKEEITKPLFAWMLALMYTGSQVQLKFKTA